MHCKLCQREVDKLTQHHLTPRSKASKGVRTPTIWICSDCHRQIHALFTNEELAAEYHTIQRLRDEARMQSFLDWMRKQDQDKSVEVCQ